MKKDIWVCAVTKKTVKQIKTILYFRFLTVMGEPDEALHPLVKAKCLRTVLHIIATLPVLPPPLLSCPH